MEYIDQITNAAVNGESEEIKALLNKEPSLLNAFNSDGWTPLHLACYFGQMDSAELLLSLGADIHIQAKNSNENMPLHAAVANKQIQAVDLLLTKGADVNAKQSGGWTSLHEASLLGDETMIKLLIEKGADIEIQKDDGKTPLEVAVEKKQDGAVHLLTQYFNNKA
ncbi:MULTISPECIES: ankyrin repeat domain-containing protein [Priestia]|uniref:Ankyrin repeat domain-containing protein n=1 Tax=Priestia aryabhattai TaxID=412384 RepID=A0AAX6N8F8_PRIAR|nr:MULTISPECIES: ankyrin repeat domain-containing protein [Priestia]MBU8851466.1 ankyrin repeat domain-containing protein [Bacillus sp. FJAT-26377]MDU9692077.1 ankyrin repeat domain-containing protein [Priestia aryabhattai]TPF16679.1 hypothetical protein CBE78_10355 [Priestia megaterium]TPF24346.1 hypothetical protein CBE79_16270 [Priestia megaterium]